MRRSLGVLAACVVLMAAAPATYGGWAVIKVEDVPAQLEAGTPTQLTFMILQHGREPMRGLKPTVTVTPEGARRGEQVRAEAGRKVGQYVATITPAAAGLVRITIDANWRETRTELLPIPVVARVAQAPSGPDESAVGRRLFVAKGCVTCHVKRDDPVIRDLRSAPVGPELTGRTWPAEWLAAKLADPAQVRGEAQGDLKMPDLDLTPSEIAALVAFLNRGAGTEVSSR
ncbi:MAG TPA: c-type cytochrome [Gemmatimonadales bacterium]